MIPLGAVPQDADRGQVRDPRPRRPLAPAGSEVVAGGRACRISTQAEPGVGEIAPRPQTRQEE